jgi:hypothetical protein
MKAPIKVIWIAFALAVIAAYALHHCQVGKIQDRFPAQTREMIGQ